MFLGLLDPLDRGTDPRIRNRTKMSRIHNSVQTIPVKLTSGGGDLSEGFGAEAQQVRPHPPHQRTKHLLQQEGRQAGPLVVHFNRRFDLKKKYCCGVAVKIYDRLSYILTAVLICKKNIVEE
jgi:hypothetical protein